MNKNNWKRWAGCCLAVLLWSTSSEALPNFVLFESGQVRPLAMSSDGKFLYAVNTPDNRLEIYRIKSQGLEHRESVPVGLEPVAVAVRNDTEVWVTNLLSDSVSIIDVRPTRKARVVRTLLVGDEPRDVVFAGPGRNRAFITTAHRGQNVPYDPQLTTPGVGRADVWVFDANHLCCSLAGKPLQIITLFTDTPRALAVSPDGARVYAAGFHTGNRTANIFADFVTPRIQPPPPVSNHEGAAQPAPTLIVKYDGQHWVDELNRNFDHMVMFNLPDRDVFVIDANASPPAILPGAAGSFAGVGTVLFNMAVNPVSGKIYVSNTEASNQNRFEGPGLFAGHTVRANHNQNRITVLSAGSVAPRHLNKHLDFSTCCDAIPNSENRKSLATPLGMAVSSNGSTLYVAAMGSSKIGVYSTAALENDTFVPDAADQISLSGGGPTGLVLDEQRGRLYALTRFDNSIAIVDVVRRRQTGKVSMYNPEPPSIVNGRRFLYDARLSSKGDSSCASCHVFGDNDSLAWDLGNPDESYLVNNNPFNVDLRPVPVDPSFAPMKGPMTTQSLRGMANHGPLHWRGDRTGSLIEPNAQPNSGAFNEREAFRQFQAGFVGLLGRPDEIPARDMEAFTDFILQLVYPPNPIRNLDNSLTAQQQHGRDFFFNRLAAATVAGAVTCESCHRLDPNANAGQPGVDFPGFFGTDGRSSREVSGQVFKTAHFRNLYTKVGMFGQIELPGVINTVPGLQGHQGDQIRGFGFLHTGLFDSMVRFFSVPGFSTNFPFFPLPEAFPVGEAGMPDKRAVEAFIFAFDSNLKPIVGQQTTLTSSNGATVSGRIALLIARADAGDCDLVVKGQLGPHERNYLYLGGGRFKPDRADAPLLTGAALRAQVNHNKDALTYTCVPPGSGQRIGIDRDSDGILDGDE